MEGGCICRQVRYRLTGGPLIVHACHCIWWERETATVHAVNALYEADRVQYLGAVIASNRNDRSPRQRLSARIRAHRVQSVIGGQMMVPLGGATRVNRGRGSSWGTTLVNCGLGSSARMIQ